MKEAHSKGNKQDMIALQKFNAGRLDVNIYILYILINIGGTSLEIVCFGRG